MTISRHKATLRALCLLAAICLIVVPAYGKYSGGTGEPNDPYQIATAADLIALGETPEDYDKHFILTVDIDLDPNLPGRRVFDKAVIAPDTNDVTWQFEGTRFTGVFEGNDHAVRNLTIAGGSYLGLFGSMTSPGQVRNLAVLDVNIAGSGDYIGALAAWNWASVSRCHASGTVSGSYVLGGLIGTSGGAVTQSCSATAVTGTGDSVGGLLGNNWGTVSNCCSSGPVTGGSFVGGLVGYLGNNEQSTVVNGYSTGAISGRSYVGGLVGQNVNGTIIQGFWDAETSGLKQSAGGVGKTTADMQTAGTFLNAGWDFAGETTNGTADIWWIFDGRDYPRLWWERVLADDFGDGEAGPLWFEYEPEPELVQITEVNGRLEITASVHAQNVDALYAPNGWRLDVTKGFAIRVDFHFTQRTGGDGRVTLGVVPSLDPTGMKWAEFEAGCFDSGPFYLYEVRDGPWVQEQVTERAFEDGTLYMSYNPDVDELYFSFKGYGKANAWQTVTGLLKGRWSGEPVYVILSGGAEGMALAGADAWLDDLVVSTGTLVSSEPNDAGGSDD